MADATLQSFMDTFLVSANVAAARAALGVALSDPSVAYVRSDGNNGTAAIGNPLLPFLTAQAAYDAGATSLDLGVGTFTLTKYLPTGDNRYLFVRGRGIDHTTFNLSWNGATGTAGTEGSSPGGSGGPGDAGATPPKLFLSSDMSVRVDIVSVGGTGGAGGNGGAGDSESAGGMGGDGGVGGDSGSFDINGVVLVTFASYVGVGGAAGAGGADGGQGEGTPGAAGVDGGYASSTTIFRLSRSDNGVTVAGSTSYKLGFEESGTFYTT